MDPLLTHLRRVRRRLHQALVWELIGRLLTALGAAFWFGLIVDRWLEPPPEVRLLVLGLAAATLAIWLGRRCVGPLFKQLPDAVVAGWLEQRLPALRQSLATAIEPGEPTSPAEQTLRREAADQAAAILNQAGVASVIAFDRPRRWVAASVVVLGSIAAIAAGAPAVFGFYVKRIALSPEGWPRRVSLEVEGFPLEADGRRVRRAATGASVELIVRADLTRGRLLPPNVEARQRLAGGVVVDSVLPAIGEPTTGANAHQPYRLTIDRIAEQTVINLRGGDARLGPLYLIAERPPEVLSLIAEITEPDYLGGAIRTAPLAVIDAAPEGALVSICGRADKALSAVEASCGAPAGDLRAVDSSVDGEEFRVRLPRLSGDAVATLRLVDRYGIAKQEPHRVSLTVKQDQPPRARLVLKGVGPTVTPTARLPAELTLEDDYGVARARLIVERTGAEGVFLPVAAADLTRRSRVELLVDLLDPKIGQEGSARPLPGQQLTLIAEAGDEYDLGEPHTTTSRRFELTIVTPDELLARLERQEINLRKTFESTVGGVRRAAIALQQAGRTDRVGDQAPPDPKGGSPRLRRRRVADELAKAEQETLSAAEAFEHIYQELENNRVPNDDLKDRVLALVAAPLRRIGERLLPAARREVEAAGDSPEAAVVAVQAALDEMLATLDQMRSLETYNEVIATLRRIITEQRSLNQATQRARRDDLRRLLLD